MLRIRLQRIGRENKPAYRIVVAEHSTRVKGRYVEQLGHFNPLDPKVGLVVDQAKVAAWIKKGAQPTDTLARLFKGAGVAGMEGYIVPMTDRKKKSEVAEAATAAAAAPAPAPAAA